MLLSRLLTIEERNELFIENQSVFEPVIDSLEQYYVENAIYPGDLSLLVPQYLEEIPQPIGKANIDYRLDELSGGYLFGFLFKDNSECGYTPRFGWDCSPPGNPH